jgi:hypothetical protein
MRGKSGVLALAAGLAGCAGTPDVTFSYYRAKWSTLATVTQTVGCSPDKKRLLAFHTPSVSTVYSSDLDNEPFSIRIRDLDGWFADTDSTMTFTDDGRLKGFNNVATGQGEAIVKSAVTLLTALGAFKTKQLPEVAVDKECAHVEAWGGGKPVTLVYRETIDSKSIGAVTLQPARESIDLHALLKNALPALTVTVSQPTEESKSGPSYDASGAPRGMVLLELQKVGTVGVTIEVDGDAIASAQFLTPRSETRKLPVPAAALFGRQTFGLAVSEAGSITSVTYGKTSGAAGFLNALQSVAATETAAAKAAELKAEADLIFQQQRLVTCQTNPKDCK